MYVANFTKESTHDYMKFFEIPTESDKITSVQKTIKSLKEQLEDAISKLSVLKSITGNELYSPIEKRIVLCYNSNAGFTLHFDLETGLPYIDDMEDVKIINCYRKNGSFTIVSGYCYPLGSVILRSYKYSIATNNSKVNIRLEEETVYPMIEDAKILCYDVEKKKMSPTMPYLEDALSNNATEFLQNFYGIDRIVKFSLKKAKEYLRKNASFEIILKTAKEEDLETLLDMNCSTSIPIHKMIGVTKQEYEILTEKDLVRNFIDAKELLNEHAPDRKFLTKNMEIIEYLEKCIHWEDNLKFYNIEAEKLYKSLIGYYLGIGYYGWNRFSEFYSIGKFSNYVVTEAINQGFTNLRGFVTSLKDYIRMCIEIGFNPCLYTTSLVLTHNVASRNYNIVITEEQESTFKSRYDNFEPFEFEDYVVIAPRKSKDVKEEGSSLDHCVASYIKNIIDGETLIVFLRLKKEISKSLITVEIREDNIVQARGYHNRDLSKQEEMALRMFARDRKIGYKI